MIKFLKKMFNKIFKLNENLKKELIEVKKEILDVVNYFKGGDK